MTTRLLMVVLVLLEYADAFLVGTQPIANPPFPTTLNAADVSSFEEWVSSQRQVSGLDKWALDNGILFENGFELAASSTDDDDWNVRLSQSASEADRVLYIPSDLIFSATRIKQELQTMDGYEEAIKYIESRQCQEQLPQFFLWIQVLREFEKGEASRWHSWIQSLPRQYDNALYLDDVELSCLPPYAWSLAKLEVFHLEVFREAVAKMPSLLSESSRQDTELARWALSVVFTRCWRSADEAIEDSDDTSERDCHIAPVGDMLNHRNPATTFIDYDDEGNCNIFLKTNVTEGSSISLSYGRTTNPSRFLVLYGFVDTDQSDIFSQVLVTNPSEMHQKLGYDVARMTVSARNGTIAQEIYDVTLFSILEQAPELQKAFYDAFVSGNSKAVEALRAQFDLEVSIVLKKHVDGKLAEVQNLVQRIEALQADDHQHHRRLPKILDHNLFLQSTFSKVEAGLDQRIQDEMKRRKSLQAPSQPHKAAKQ